MTPTDPATLGKWVMWLSLIGGAATFAIGWRQRGRTGEALAPVGLLGTVAGAQHFLWGAVPDAVAITIDVLVMLAITWWHVRLYQASRQRIRELRQRNTP
jgi:hypothetical protein